MIRRATWPGVLFLSIFLLLSACESEAVIPTLAVTAPAPPSPQPTNTPLPTSTSTPIPPTNTPTLTPTPSVTPVIPRLEETPFAESGVNITSPRERELLTQGTEIAVGGLIWLRESETLSVSLVNATGQEIAVADVEVHQFGNWDGTVGIPASHSGTARLLAKILDRENSVVAQDEHELSIGVNLDLSDQYLDLYHPAGRDLAVAGYNLFFDGIVQRPVNNLVSISLWDDDCQVQIARQSFRLRGSGYWQGFLVVPSNASGPACAVAHFGEPGSKEWREAQVAVEILPSRSDDSYGVLVGNPPPGSKIEPGKSLLLYGTAYNAPDGEIRITIQSEDGRLITEGITSADVFGYWELSLFIPDDARGVVEIGAAIGDSEDVSYAEHRILVEITGSD
jgi:hypothetical protein